MKTPSKHKALFQVKNRSSWIYGLAALTASWIPLSAAHWPSWRGPDGSGSTDRGTYPTSWTAETVTWKVALPGKGGSSPIFWNNSIYLTSPSDGQDSVLAFDLNGKKLWETRLGPESPAKHRTLGSSCNSSPVTDGEGLFVYFRSGHFAALEFDGTVRWKQNLTEIYGAEELFWDQGSSPVVTGDHVILTRMHQGDSWVAGFNKKTGKVEWKESRNFKVPTENDNGYSTPVFFNNGDRKAMLVWGADHITAHTVADGKQIWSVGDFNPNETGFWPAIASPVISQGVAVVPVGRDDRPRQANVYGVRLGPGKPEKIWHRDDLGVFVTSLATFQDKIYLLRHRGEVVCLDPADGKTIWSAELPRTRSSYYASPVIANGILYAAREDGVVFSARIGDAFELLGENPLGERVLASPVPAANRLLVRGDEHLFCIGDNSSAN